MEDIVQIEPFNIIGISVRTSNKDGKSAEDMGQLWSTFFAQDITTKVPAKVSNDIYTIYTDYDTDHTGAYTAILGYKVATLEYIPDGLTGKAINADTYRKYSAQGKMPDAVVEKWMEIWRADKNLNRKYSADLEVYGAASQNPDQPIVDIFIAVQ